MDGLAGDVPHPQQAGEAVGHIFCVAEGDHPVIAPDLHQPDHGVHLLVPVHIQAVLGDVRLVLFVGPDGDLHRVPLVHPGDVHDLPGDCGGKQTQVAPLGHQVQDPGHVPDKAHIQHPVGLVQHHRLHLVQAEGAALHMVHQPPRCGHHDLGPLLQLGDLLVNGLSAVQADGAHPLFEGAQVPQLVPDLDGQFPGGGQHQPQHIGGLRIDVLHHGDAEGKGLSRPGGRLGDHIPVLHKIGDRAPLDRGRLNIPLLLNGLHQGLGQAQVCIPHFFVDKLAVDLHRCSSFHSVLYPA